MDYKRIQEIIDNFIQNNQAFVKNINRTVNLSKELYLREIKKIDYEWSRNFTINESIAYVYNFIESISQDLADQYYNIVTSVNENNEPYVNFVDSKNENAKSEAELGGKVTISYDNTPQDMFTILHEMLHKMNDCLLVYDGVKAETKARANFTETVSILGELLLGDYLVKNNIITESDLEKQRTWRLSDSRVCAIGFIVQNELIKMRLQGIDINEENALEVINSYDENSVERKILKNKKIDLTVLNRIIEDNELFLRKLERYINAQVLSEKMYNSPNAVEQFLNFHDAIGSENAQEKINNTIKR